MTRKSNQLDSNLKEIYTAALRTFKKGANMKTPIFLNGKGCAMLAAIDSGLIPEQNGGYDTDQFEKIWSLYLDNQARVYRASGESEKEPRR